mgnify:CR=1 FL=1
MLYVVIQGAGGQGQNNFREILMTVLLWHVTLGQGLRYILRLGKKSFLKKGISRNMLPHSAGTDAA